MEVEKQKQVFSDKYDRQIRLWGANGQACLKNSKILLLNCEPSGVETLKNLVLPGVGNITTADNQNVTEKDLGKNFFVTQEDLNQNRAKAVYNNLLEMNPDCNQGGFEERNPNELCKDQDYLKQFTLIVASELQDESLSHLSRHCNDNNIALIIINTVGYIGRIRLQNGNHTVVESKPLQAQYFDMRLNQPFEQLQKLADSYDIETINNKIQKGVIDGESGKSMNELMHIPYGILLIKALAIYRQQNDGKDPKTFAEKKKFKVEVLKKMGEKLQDAGNFEQAESYAYHCFNQASALPTYVHGGVKKIFEHSLLNTSQDNFWVLSRALKQFYDKNGVLPVSLNLPDMESSTENFLKLKAVFKEKFEQDLAEFTQILNQQSQHQISEFDIKLFVQNVCYLTVIEFKPYFEELNKAQDLQIDVNYNDQGQAVINNSYQWIVGFKGLNSWLSKNGGTYPKYQKDEDSLHQEIENQRQNYFNIVGEGQNESIKKTIAEEICRVQNAKLHNIGAIMGGIASQEAVKLITHQFQPLNNTFIYDGIHSISQSIQL